MRLSALLVSGCVLAACAPDLPLDDGLVTSPRILAVKAEPAEAKPGALATYAAFVAEPDGARDLPPVAWEFCTAPKPPTENNVVSNACLEASSLTPAGEGNSITAATSTDACSLFGPDTPPGGFRPRDPDVTGGYYQPLRADLAGAAPVFHSQRLLCDLGAAPADIASEFAAEYVPNVNPQLLPVAFSVSGSAVSPSAIPRGARVKVDASWPSADAETYAYYDRVAQAVTTRRESMRVAWYVSAGSLEAASTGRDEDDPQTSTSNVWTAPTTPGSSKLWLVLRDARGGVDFADYELDVNP
jgi:hypothetical protein